MNEEVKGKSNGKKASNPSSPDMDEYEVIGKGILKISLLFKYYRFKVKHLN